MKEGMRRRGVLGLEFWHNGMKQISASKPLILPTDAAGLKFRVQPSDVLVAQMEALGASPQPMAFAEVYGALQTGVVDGQENSWSNIYTQKFFEVQDGITETNHQMLTYLMVAPTEWLDGLDPEVRDKFLGIVEREVDAANAKANAINAEARAKIIEAGSVVRELTDEQRQAWVDAMRPVWDQFIEDVGQDTVDAAVEIGKQGS
jgi:C4-dicarboxylate-binding protein DctP